MSEGTILELNETVYNTFEDNYVHWNRIHDTNDIIVWTRGYKTRECSKMEEFLSKFNMICLSMEFDKMCGKTRCTYRIRK